MTVSELYPKLMDAALRFVSMRPRSKKEIELFLARTLARHHTTAPSVVKEVMTRLADLAYIDDPRFAAWWVSQRRIATPKGKALIRRELMQKGVAKEDVEVALAGAGDEKEAALRTIGTRQKTWEKKRLWAYLARRGFSHDTIRSVVDDTLGKEYNSDDT